MWNRKRSVKLSIAVCAVMALLIASCAVALPFFYYSYTGNKDYSNIGLIGNADKVIFAAVYIAVAVIYAAFYQLVKLLLNIRKNEIFIAQNVKALRIISWCCFAVAAVLFIAGILILPLHFITFFLIAFAAAFGGLLLRVVKNVMQTALEIREENDLTI